MRHLIFAVMFAMTGAGCSPDQPEDPRSCYRTGWMEADACNYVLSELASMQAGSDAGVRLFAYLQERNGQLLLTEHQDGSGVHVAVGEVLDDDQFGQPITWMAGHRVSVHGIYHLDTQILDIHSIGVVEEPDVSKPLPPFDGPPGVFTSLKSDKPDPGQTGTDAESRHPPSGGFLYDTHDDEGVRICSDVWYTPEERCHYLLDELVEIHEPAVVGVRLYGFLVSRSDGLSIATSREAMGTAVPVTQIDDAVPEWLVDLLVETGHPMGLNGQYFPETKTIRAFSLSYVNLPGETPFRVPPPDQR